MTDSENDNIEGDPWLTVAEIAAELRINPATVRLWISRGKLRARRAGQRKLLVRRSELDRMLEVSSHRYDDVPSQTRDHSRRPTPRRPVRLRVWSAVNVAAAKVPPELMQAAVKELQEAGAVWDAALEASEQAPPDPQFINRLRAIAKAAERQHQALERAGSIPGFLWKPVPDTEDMILSNELRPGGNRPGPKHLWDQFDMTVDRLALAMEGNYTPLVGTEYRSLARVLCELIEALEPEQATASDDDDQVDGSDDENA